jgi:aminoglycoside phosphotransferase (APT) family kinase protein
MTVELPHEVDSWALGTVGTEIIGRSPRELGGGAVAKSVELHTLTVATPAGEVERRVVRKWGFDWEVTALRAAQAVLDHAPAVPELIADGDDDDGAWFVTPFYDGQLPFDVETDTSLFESLAAVHAHCRGGGAALSGIPTVDTEWWAGLCLNYTLPAIAARNEREPHPTMDRAEAVIREVAEHHAVGRALERLTPTLIHNDVHPGNLIVSHDGCVLIDWGSARVGPAVLDLANVTQQDSPAVERYRAQWRRVTGEALAEGEVEGGFRWARLQIPVQYLAWVTGARPIDAVGNSVELIEQALSDITTW